MSKNSGSKHIRRETESVSSKHPYTWKLGYRKPVQIPIGSTWNNWEITEAMAYGIFKEIAISRPLVSAFAQIWTSQACNSMKFQRICKILVSKINSNLMKRATWLSVHSAYRYFLVFNQTSNNFFETPCMFTALGFRSTKKFKHLKINEPGPVWIWITWHIKESKILKISKEISFPQKRDLNNVLLQTFSNFW